jgi:hypothetical protein
MSSLLRKRRNASEHERVRIAVLDTGIFAEPHPYWNIIQDYKGYKGFKDFVVRGNELGVDQTGHGTIAVHLILKLLPEAHVFVGRVFQGRHANENTPSLMAEVSC